MDNCVINLESTEEYLKTPLQFQVLDWTDRDETEEIEKDSDDSPEKNLNLQENYVIYAYGRTIEGYSVSLKIIDYTPFFHILLPDFWNTKFNNFLIQYLKDNVYYKYKKCIVKEKCKMIKKKSLDYFRGDDMGKFLRLVFTTRGAFYAFSRILKKGIKFPFYSKKIKFNLFETTLEPKLKFFHLKNIEPCNWITSSKITNKEDSPFSISQINCETKWTNISKLDCEEQAPFLVMSFDIECTSEDGVSFPEAKNKNDNVIQIGSTFNWYGKSEEVSIVYKHIVTLGSCEKIENVDVETYKKESDLLIGWTNMVQRINPDIHIGYNIFGFDYKYLYDRAKMYYILPQFSRIGKMLDEECEIKEKTLASSALGMNVMHVPETSGIVIIDVYKSIMRDYKLPYYKLDYVAELYLGQKKNDVSPKDIFKLQKGTAKDRKIIAEYCIQDNILCNLLIEKLSIILNNVGMANVCYVPLSYLFLRGQGIKSQSLIAKECLKEGYLMKTLNAEENTKDISYEGAIVFEPDKSELFLEPVSVLDFASLYPSIMRTKNICLSTYVYDKKYLNLSNYNYEKIEFDDTDGTHRVYYFAVNKNGEKGILPTVVTKLLKARKETRAKIKTEKNVFKKKMFNSLQLGYKVSANSVYGALGAKTSQIYCRPAASSITAMGRQYLIHSKKYAEEKHSAKCIYGDSITGNTIVTCRNIKNKIEVKNIEKLGKKWEPYLDEKEQAICNLDAWTHNGWKPILRVIRHKTKKKIYKVYTNKGILEVTEDHSLLDENLNIIKPKDVNNKKLYINKINNV